MLIYACWSTSALNWIIACTIKSLAAERGSAEISMLTGEEICDCSAIRPGHLALSKGISFSLNLSNLNYICNQVIYITLRIMKQLTALLLIVILSNNVFTSNVNSPKRLPNVTLHTLNGEKINIADFGTNGKITVLNFWATWCTPCKKELNNIADIYDEWVADYNVEVIAISIDDSRNKAKVKSYARGQSWEYEILLDSNQALKRALNFQTIPYTILVDLNGNIVYKHNGYIEGDEFELEDEIKKISG